MARVALVSRNPAMAMGLASTDHSVVEIRPATIEDWLADGEDVGVDAVVLDVGSPTKASTLIGDLRAEQRWTPFLIIVGDGESAAAAGLPSLPNVELLPLPIDPAKLQAAVSHVLTLPRTVPVAAVPAWTAPAPEPTEADLEPDDHAPLVEAVPELVIGDEPAFLADELLPEADPVESEPVEPGPVVVSELNEPESAEPEPAEPESAGPETPEPRWLPQLLEREEPDGDDSPTVDEPPTDSAEPAPSVMPPQWQLAQAGPAAVAMPMPAPLPAVGSLPAMPQVGSTGLQASDPSDDPVATLLATIDGRYTLEETAGVVVEGAVAECEADAGAILVPDGEIWRVAAGVDLRPLELRLQLAADSWLIDNVAGAGKGLLIENSDGARQNLRGAPLASRAHLVVAPVRSVQAVLLLARDDNRPFTEQTLAELAALAAESAPLLRSALQLRELARGLSRHLNPVD